MLHCEVISAFSDFPVGIARGDEGPPWRCPLCPWRDLSSHSRLLDHVHKKHTDRVKFVCSGTKQLKVVMSMYSLDSFSRRHVGNHLQRSADRIRMSASPGGWATDTSIDRILRMVLTGNGPSVVHRSPLCVLHKVRRVGNILFTRCFAEVFLRMDASERQSSEEVHGPFPDTHPTLWERARASHPGAPENNADTSVASLVLAKCCLLRWGPDLSAVVI